MMSTTAPVYRTSNTFLAPAVIVIFGVITVAIPATLIVVLSTSAAPASDWHFAMLALGGVVAVMGTAGASHHRVEVGDHEVRLTWFPAYRTTIPVSEIVSVTTTKVSPWSDGLGIRFVGESTLALMNRGGEALLVGRTGERRYLVVIRDPQELAETLRRLDDMIRKCRLTAGRGTTARRRPESTG